MDLLSYVISIAMLALAIQFGELWIVLGLVMILIVAAKDLKVSILMIVSVVSLYLINGMGMKDYWLIVVLGLIALGYILGVGKEEEGAGADPYAALLGGGMGGLA
jgi:cell division protein FtsW (lipid II flippase)